MNLHIEPMVSRVLRHATGISPVRPGPRTLHPSPRQVWDELHRRLPRQAHSLKFDGVTVVGLGRKVSGGTFPRLSRDRSVL